MWSLLGKEEHGETLKICLLQNQKSDDIANWQGALGIQGLQILQKLPRFELKLF